MLLFIVHLTPKPGGGALDRDRPGMVYLLPFLSYFAGSKSVSARLSVRPSYPDTMTNTAIEAIV